MGKGSGRPRPEAGLAARLGHVGAMAPLSAALDVQPHPAMDWEAVRTGDVARVERSVRRDGVPVDAVQLRADGDRTALHTAALHGHGPLVASLIRMRADPFARATCRCGRLATAVAQGPVRLRPRAGGHNGATSDVQLAQTPLELATRAGHHEVAQLLRMAMGLPPPREPRALDREQEAAARAALEVDAAESERVARAAERARAAELAALRAGVGGRAVGATAATALGPDDSTPPPPPPPEADEAPPPPPPPAERGAALLRAGAPSAREVRGTLGLLLNPNGLVSWQPPARVARSTGRALAAPCSARDRAESRVDADAGALFDNLRLRPSLADAQRREGVRAAELRAMLREPDRLRDAAQGAAGKHPAHEAYARGLPLDALVQRAAPPAGGLAEAGGTRWR